MEPVTITAIGGAVAAIAGAIGGAFGGKKGGENSLNGFKDEVRTGIATIHEKLDGLTKTDGAHEARLERIEVIVDRRLGTQPVLEERRVAPGA